MSVNLHPTVARVLNYSCRLTSQRRLRILRRLLDHISGRSYGPFEENQPPFAPRSPCPHGLLRIPQLALLLPVCLSALPHPGPPGEWLLFFIKTLCPLFVGSHQSRATAPLITALSEWGHPSEGPPTGACTPWGPAPTANEQRGEPEGGGGMVP